MQVNVLDPIQIKTSGKQWKVSCAVLSTFPSLREQEMTLQIRALREAQQGVTCMPGVGLLFNTRTLISS